MRIISTIVVAALVGVLAGGAIAYVEVRSDPDAIDKLADELAANAKAGDKEVASDRRRPAALRFRHDAARHDEIARVRDSQYRQLRR